MKPNRRIAILFAVSMSACTDEGHDSSADNPDASKVEVDGSNVPELDADRPDAEPEALDASVAIVDDARLETQADATIGAGRDASVDANDGLRSVTIRFKAKLGESDLECGRSYPDLGTTKVAATPQDFRFFVQDVWLKPKGGGTAQKVVFGQHAPFQSADVALLDFTDAKGKCAANGQLNTAILGRVVPGQYDAITFVNGVPESLNHAGPAETATAPLDDVSLFWHWKQGYRFVVAELAPVASGSGAFVSPAFVHVGSGSCDKVGASYACQWPMRNEITLTDFDPDSDTIIADLSAVFAQSDLENAVPSCHSVGPSCKAPYAALGVNMDNGQPLASQSVFRVE